MTPETMLATVAAAGDTPRQGHVAAAYDLRAEALAALGGDLSNEGEIARRIDRGSINQRGGYRSALYLLAPESARPGVLVVLHRQLVELLESELGSTTYPGINRGWILAIYLVARRIGDEEVAALALRIMRLVIAVEKALECPSSAHPKLRGRTVTPGGRSGDRNGMSAIRDECRSLETTGRSIERIRTGQQEVELWMVKHAIDSGILPKLQPAPLAEVRTRWPLRVRYYEHGHEAVFFAGMDRAIGALEAVSVDYRREPLREGTHGGAVEWVGWDTWAPKWKKSQPEGWNFPWRFGAPPLPERDLGRLLREKVIGEGAEEDRPEPPQPKPPEPPQPPPPKPTPPPPETSGPPIPARGRHVQFRVDAADIIVNILPGGKWEGRRWRPDGGDWQDFP